MNKLQQEINSFHNQKCSYKSTSDTDCLCSLAYWLYIYGDKELALKICEIAHGVEFSFEFRDWNSGIQNIYGLEIRIARELLGENRRNNIPLNLLEYCFSKKVKKELRYPQVLREDKIADCSSRFLNTELLLALYNMIGLGETGLFTEINRNWEKIEEAINFYIDYLNED